MNEKNNSGKENSGNYNSGYSNSGNYNSGNRNSGYRNSGNYNSGNYNSGYSNSGYSNSGNYNSGNRNSGDYNSGDYNSGDYNSGFFNTDEPNVRLFNKNTNLKLSDIKIPYLDLKVTEWVSEDKMTEQQKLDDPKFFVKKGTLIKRTYKEAWNLAWKALTKEYKQQFLDLPNFDVDIFFEITGVDVRLDIDLNPTKTISCEGKVVEIDGKKYRLTEI